MSVEALRSLFKWLRKAGPDKLRLFAAKLTSADLLQLDAWFELWAHKSQLPPNGEGWRVWLMMAGRGFGKMRAGASGSVASLTAACPARSAGPSIGSPGRGAAMRWAAS